MESKRQQKFAALLQEELAQMFQKEGKAYLPNTLVTITKVRVSPDLGVAKVYLSFFHMAESHVGVAALNAHVGEIRYKLGARIRHQVRVIPELTFFVDDTNAYVEKMDEIFNKIAQERQDNPPATEDTSNEN